MQKNNRLSLRLYSVVLLMLTLFSVSCSKPPSQTKFSNNEGANVQVDPSLDPNGTRIKRIASGDKEPLKRLSKSEYRRVVLKLFGDFFDKAAFEKLTSDQIPGDVPGQVFDNADQTISKGHILAYNAIAESVAILLTDSSKFKTTAGCMSFNKECSDKFLKGPAARILRRPLTSIEKASYGSLFAAAGSNQVGFTTMLAALLQAPQFIYKIELADGKGALTPFELAARLSFGLTDAGPDDQLWKAAEQGLSGDSSQKEVERIFDLESSRPAIRMFLTQWLGQKEGPQSDYSKVYLQGLDVTGIEAQAFAEVQELLDYFVWETPGTIKDVFTTRKAFHKKAVLKSIYEADKGDAGEILSPLRAGVQGRVSFLATGTNASHLVHRGLLLRRNLLCDTIGFPVTTPENMKEFAPPKPDPKASTRKQIEDRTAPITCQGCHSRINPPGFAFEVFDGVGRSRTTEKVYDDKGALLASLPVDPVIEATFEAGKVTKILGPETISTLLGESEVAQKCFVRRWYQYLSRRELTRADECYLDQMSAELKAGKSIKELMIETLGQEGFRKLKNCN